MEIKQNISIGENRVISVASESHLEGVSSGATSSSTGKGDSTKELRSFCLSKANLRELQLSALSEKNISSHERKWERLD